MWDTLTALGVGALVLVVLALTVKWWTRQTHKKRKAAGPEAIPGWTRPPAHLERGDLDQVLSCGSLALYLQQQHQGGRRPVIAFWWKQRRVVSLCGPEAFKHSENIYNRPQLSFIEFGEVEVTVHGAKSIQSINDAEWVERKKLVYGTLRDRNLEGCFQDFVSVVREAVKRWKDGCDGDGGREIETKREMLALTLKGVLTALFGGMFAETWRVGDLYDRCKKEEGSRILNLFPVDKQRDSDFRENVKQLQDCMKEIAETRKKQDCTKKPLPFLDALVFSELPEECIISDMITVLGGFHTSGYYLTWLLLFLAEHPATQDRLVREGRERWGNSTEALQAYVSTSNSFLRQVIDEGLRLSCTAPYSSHYSDYPLEVCGYVIPAKTPFIHSMGVTQTSEDIWERAGSFEPDRFAPGTDLARRGREFRPFGVSCYRRCPANQFTYMMVSVFLAVLIQHFSFHTCSSQEQPQERVEKEYSNVTGLKEDIRLRVELRK